LALRRDRVSEEALRLKVVINEEGIEEVLDYRLYFSESSENQKKMMIDLKVRGRGE